MLKLEYCSGCEPILNNCHIFVGDNWQVTESPPTLKRIHPIYDLLYINNALRSYFNSNKRLMRTQVGQQKEVNGYFQGNKHELDKASFDIKSHRYYRNLEFEYLRFINLIKH